MKSYIKILTIYVLIVMVLLTTPVRAVGEIEGIKSSTPLSFVKEYPLVQQDLSFGVAGASIGGNANFDMKIRTDMVLLTEASSKYAEKGSTTTLYIDTLNFISLLELTGSVNIYASYLLVKYNLPVKTVNLKYAVPQAMGAHQQVIIGGDQFLGSITIPVLGPIDIFMRVSVEWTPTLRGSLAIDGPASVTSTDLMWSQNSLSTQLSFLANEPVGISLSNPELILGSFEVVVYFYAMYGVMSSPSFPVDVVTLGDYSLTSPSVNLISFEPNYYVLYEELKQSITSLISTIQQLQSSQTTLSSRLEDTVTSLNQLTDKVNSLIGISPQLGTQLPLIIFGIVATIALVVSLYSLLKSRKVERVRNTELPVQKED